MDKARGRHAGHDEEHEDSEDNYVIFEASSLRFGSLSTRSECAMQNQTAFLNGKPSYLLYYFWELADRNQLLLSSLQRLDDDVGASDASSSKCQK